jgi:transcriptional regulator with XRE-family HTH domain
MSQEEVAEAAGINQPTLSLIESGKTGAPSMNTFNALYDVLDRCQQEPKSASLSGTERCISLLPGAAQAEGRRPVA